MDNFLRHYTRILSNVIKRSVEMVISKRQQKRSQFQLPKLCDTEFHRLWLWNCNDSNRNDFYTAQKDEITNGQQRPRKIANLMSITIRIKFSFS
jgi:hypothetical protein